jgi:hypothetical protein
MTLWRPTVGPVVSAAFRIIFVPDAEAQPELMAAMVKRTSGFSPISPKGGDWEYLIPHGALTRILPFQLAANSKPLPRSAL